MLKELKQRLEQSLGKDYINKDYSITSKVNTQKVRGSVRMMLGKIYTPEDRANRIDNLLSIKLPK